MFKTVLTIMHSKDIGEKIKFPYSQKDYLSFTVCGL